MQVIKPRLLVARVRGDVERCELVERRAEAHALVHALADEMKERGTSARLEARRLLHAPDPRWRPHTEGERSDQHTQRDVAHAAVATVGAVRRVVERSGHPVEDE